MRSNLLCSILALLLVSLAFATPVDDQASQKKSRFDNWFQKVRDFMKIKKKSGVTTSNIEEAEPSPPLPDIPADTPRHGIFDRESPRDFSDFRLARENIYSDANSRFRDSASVAESCGETISAALLKQHHADKAQKCLWAVKNWTETLDNPETITVALNVNDSYEAAQFLFDKELFEATENVHFIIRVYADEGQSLSKKLFLAIAENEFVKTFYFTGKRLGKSAKLALTNMLVKNSGLQEVGIAGNLVRPDVVAALAEGLKTNTAVLKLFVYAGYIGKAGLKALAEALEINSSLKELDLMGLNIRDQGVKLLAAGLKRNSGLRLLKLNHNRITQRGAGYLSEALSDSELEALEIINNRIPGAGVAALVRNTKLKKLHVGFNGIDDEGAVIIAEALKTNVYLQDLSISGGSIRPEGARALAAALETNTVLESLDMELHEVGDEGAKAFAHMLKKNTSLRELNLNENRISSEGVDPFVDALERNNVLKKLNLGKHNVTFEVKRKLSLFEKSRMNAN